MLLSSVSGGCPLDNVFLAILPFVLLLLLLLALGPLALGGRFFLLLRLGFLLILVELGRPSLLNLLMLAELSDDVVILVESDALGGVPLVGTH